MTFRKQRTSKLFYGKWPFKIKCRCAGAWMVKRNGVNDTLRYCLSRDAEQFGYRRNYVDKAKLRDFSKTVEPYLNREDIQIRTEGDTFSLYCKDIDLYNKILAHLSGYISEAWEPETAQELDYVTNNSHKKVLSNQLPYEKYQYRVYFKPDCDSNTKEALARWVPNYGDKIKMSNGTLKWCFSGWRQGPFVYVQDQSTLSMICLFMGHNIHKIEEFILRSSINTILDQDNVCQHLASG